ncbi:hypothetical protein M2M59_06975 [Rummeliibacillus sp. G93]|uniref:hypothetical protein n=1 Tax=Rummeliibacillus TaxID=648802 RepID=UPI0011671331|nr:MULTISPECIES: hypothetical protein [Rummeliibacillus]MBB5169490.1 uncharacterized membrane protein (DUF485 family) [Rummeliibacillus stabekisii]UQW98751.1 hypothetical protein M2M59_06975 [Rummeliibacillus sp. G93]GEL03749.1 hypothetical protein RST01_03760 [Rummeliibacillus stabekisii]
MLVFTLFLLFFLSVLLIGLIFSIIFLVSFIKEMIENKRNGLPIWNDRMKIVVLVAIVLIVCTFFYEVYH